MTAANAYIDTQTAKIALQTAAPQATAANVASAAKVEPAKNMASFSQFERKCLKKISKRRNAKLVHVACSPLQGEQAETSLRRTRRPLFARCRGAHRRPLSRVGTQ